MRLRLGNVFKYKKSLITVLFIAVSVGVLILIVKGLNAPAQGSISQIPPSKAEKKVPFSQPGAYKGKYISLTYPAHFKIEPSTLSGSYIETVAIGSTAQSGAQINIGILHRKITDESAVSYRRQHTELYKETDSARWIEFTKLDNTEDTFFIEHGDLLASISASAPNANLNGEASYIASGLKWR